MTDIDPAYSHNYYSPIEAIKVFSKSFNLQGGPSFDVFSIQGKDPLAKLKVHGPSSAVRKEFDGALRTFILNLQGDSARSRIEYPKNSSKQSLHLTQRYLVFQLFLQADQSFALEVAVVTRSTNLKLRIILSSSCREIAITSHHVKMPCSMVETLCWVSLVLDMEDLVANYFEGNMFGHVDSVVVSANCKLKRIFSLKDRPAYVTDLPKNVSFPINIDSIIQVNFKYNFYTTIMFKMINLPIYFSYL